MSALLIFPVQAEGPHQEGPDQGLSPVGASTLGDLVWYDANINGIQDDGPTAGLDDVIINLYRDDGDAIFEPNGDDGSPYKVARTGDDSSTSSVEHGWYDFINIPAEGVIYWVSIAESNFEPGGTLEHYVYTGHLGVSSYSGDEPRLVYLADAVVDYNDADFGFTKAEIELIVTAGDAADGQALAVATNEKVTLTYKLTNVGDTYLANAKITSDNGTPDDDSDDTLICTISKPLAPNDSETCTSEETIDHDITINAKATANPVTSSGSDLPGNDAQASDDATIVLNRIAIGNRVWDDASGSPFNRLNGKMDSDERGIGGVTVQLYRDNGDGHCDPATDNKVAETSTDPRGYYTFLNVAPGSYCVAIPSNIIDAILGKAKITKSDNHHPDSSDEMDSQGNDGILQGNFYITNIFDATPNGQQHTTDLGDPQDYDDASAYMTIDFGFAKSDASAVQLATFRARDGRHLFGSLGWLIVGFFGLAAFAWRAKR